MGEKELTAVQARDLLEAEKTRPYSHVYPFEWIICFAILTGVMGWDKRRSGLAIDERLTPDATTELDAQRPTEMAAINARLAACERWMATHDLVLVGLPKRVPAAKI